MQRCLIISFDFTKPDYPDISYSVASILAKFKNSDFIDIEQCSYNLIPYLLTPKAEIETIIKEKFKKTYLEKTNDYSFIALSAYAWSENLVNELIEIIRPVFNGKIILGGYEITALSNEKLPEIYPNVDYYIKGYAEKALEKIFKHDTNDTILNEKVCEEDFVSPYLSGVFQLNKPKIHWESKRGCPYHCDYCEYGAAASKVGIIRIDDDRISQEIELFKESNIKEINVLDATFLIDEKDIETLKKLLTISNCKFAFQMHFNSIKGEKGERFIEICTKHKDRITLEFGLQTIHEKEMKILKRENDIAQLQSVMQQLNERKINYEISIIFGIPGQTVDSFQETITFIEENGCNKFCAFPLQLPKNSKMRERINELQIKELQGEHFSLKFVSECNSFNQSEWEKMYILTAFREDKPPFCGDPLEAIKPTIDKITDIYLRGGINCKFKSSHSNTSLF
ncbi:hypothetical protein FACS189437_03340 [Bacteroidia bacterium]|nr:hypothetical protein FACS189437_03340 [Bacteroidia bacterium]